MQLAPPLSKRIASPLQYRAILVLCAKPLLCNPGHRLRNMFR